MFFPKRIAVAGLSPRPEAWARLTVRFLQEANYPGEIVALRPRQEDPAIRSIDSLDDIDHVDLLVVAVPADGVVNLIAEASAANVGGAVIFASGFAEEGESGSELQAKLAAAAGAMPVLGPNCLGLISDPASVIVSVSGFLQRSRTPGPVAMVSQSGAMGYILAEQLRRRGLGFSYYASTGNEAVLGAADLLEYLSQRPEVEVVGCYLEGVRDVSTWRRACAVAAANGCRVVALKVGSTEASQRAALSHTASAAGEAELFEAICREDGVLLVKDEVAFAEAVCALGNPVSLKTRPGVGIITMSGGGGAMIADQLGEIAEVPALSTETTKRLRDLDIALAGDNNPVDLTGMFPRQFHRLDEVVSIVGEDPGVDILALYFTFGDLLIEKYRELGARLAKMPIPTWFIWAGAAEGEVESLAKTGRVVSSIPAFVRNLQAQPRLVSDHAEVALTKVSNGGLDDIPAGSVLTEFVLGATLAAAGFPFVPMVIGASKEEVIEAVSKVQMPPAWVAKVDHPGVPHRASLGLVEVGVNSVEQLEATLERLFTLASDLGFSAANVVVEPMLNSQGNFSLGAFRHPTYGPMALVGPGGNRAEEAGAKRTAASLPISAVGLSALAAAISELVGCQVTEAVVAQLVVPLSELLVTDVTITEVDVNPVLLTADGSLVAVDALAIRGNR